MNRSESNKIGLSHPREIIEWSEKSQRYLPKTALDTCAFACAHCSIKQTTFDSTSHPSKPISRLPQSWRFSSRVARSNAQRHSFCSSADAHSHSHKTMPIILNWSTSNLTISTSASAATNNNNYVALNPLFVGWYNFGRHVDCIHDATWRKKSILLFRHSEIIIRYSSRLKVRESTV